MPSPITPRPHRSDPADADADARRRRRLARWVVEVRTVPSGERRATYGLAGGLVLVGLTVFLVLLQNVLTHSGLQQADRPVAEWFTVRRAEVALALAIAVIALAYVLTPSGSAARFVLTFAAGAVSLAALRFLILQRRDRR